MANLVQRGLATVTANSQTVSLATAIDTSKSFIVIKPLVPGNNPSTFREGYFQTTGSSISSFTIAGFSPTSTPVYWSVITMDNISVQHFGDQTFASASTSVAQTISSVTTGSTFCIVTGSVNTTTGANGYQGFYMADLTSSTNVNVTRGTSGTAGVYSLQVISFTDGSTVQKASFTITGTSNTQTLGTAVSLTSGFFFFAFNITAGGLSSIPRIALASTTTITATRVASSGSTTTAIAYVISMAGASKEHDSGTDIPADPTAVTVSNLTDLSLAFTILSNSSTGTGTNWANGTSAAEITSLTNVNLHPASTTQTTAYDLQTIQLPASSGGGGSAPQSGFFALF